MFDSETPLFRAAEANAPRIEFGLKVRMSTPALSITHLIHLAPKYLCKFYQKSKTRQEVGHTCDYYSFV